MQLRFAIEGNIELSRVFNALANNVVDWSGAFKLTSDYLIQTFSNDVFETEGAAIDEYWTPLSPAYAKAKAKKYGDIGILQKTGLMRSSFKPIFDSTSLEIWNTQEYFKYHQSKLPRTKIPRRMMMKLTSDMRANIVRIFQAQLSERIEA